MLSFQHQSAHSLARQLSARIRDLRLHHGWSRAELGARAGVAVPTLRRFEDTGQISLERLLKLASALDFVADFDHVAAYAKPNESLDDAERALFARTRKRGRTLGKPKA